MDGLKSGWKTTEFWVTLVTGGLTVLGHVDPRATVVLAALSAVYTAGRSVIKAFTPARTASGSSS